ncbi:hypothetical protein ACFO0M_28210 [Micromonospora mangrovi]|uniref:WD40 repeat protein n=2 Tax=Micromonospora TaxID=1873 RepID=A0AAU8HJB4_9ACTN
MNLNRRTMLRGAALAGAAAVTGLAGGLTRALPASAADTTGVVNGPWLVSTYGVFTVEPGRTTPRLLIDNCRDGVASPDGRYVAVLSGGWRPGEPRPAALSVFDRVTGQLRPLLAAEDGVHWEWPVWSPDGTEIALLRERDTLLAVDVATGGTRILVQGHTMSKPHWSRDGSMITMWWYSRSEGPQLRTLTLATGKLRRIYSPGVEGEYFSDPVFMPNSERVVFSTSRWAVAGDPYTAQSLASVRIDGTGFKRLTDGQWMYSSPVFSPDGRYCAAMSVPRTNEYPDGGNIIVTTSGFGDSWWIPGDEYDDSSRIDWARAL